MIRSLFSDEKIRLSVYRRIFEYLWLFRSNKPMRYALASGYTRLLLLLSARIHPNLKKYDWQYANGYFSPTPSEAIWQDVITDRLNKKGGPRILRLRWHYYDKVWTDEEICQIILSTLQSHGISHIHEFNPTQMAEQTANVKQELIEIIITLLENNNPSDEEFKWIIKTYVELEEDLKQVYKIL